MRLRIPILIGLILTALACQTLMPQAPQAPQATQESQPPQSIPPEQPLAVPQSEAGIAARGFAAVTGSTINFHEKNGLKYAEIRGPEYAFWETDRLHVAGPMPAGAQTVPLMYFVLDQGETLVYRDANGQMFNLAQGQGFMGLTGVPAQPLVAFASVEYLEMALRSKIYAGSPQTLPNAAPLLTIDDPEGWAVKPILLETTNSAPSRIWYTRIAYGIGGDIVFEPRKSLRYLDVPSGQASQVLGDDVSPWDISPNHQWVAYSSEQNSAMALRNLQTGASIAYNPLPAANPRGAGNAFFSPNGQSLAWMEGDGWLMAETPNFHATVRIGDLNGNVIAEFADSALGAALPGGKAAWVEPVGWLDSQTLLVQTRGTNWDEAAIVTVDTASQRISYLAPGVFVGLVYP